MSQKQEARRTVEEQKNIILGILDDFLSDVDELISYLDHVGFDLGSIRDARDTPSAFLGHYRLKKGVYDVDRACNHLATWPPIAARILELRAERDGV